MPRVKVRGVKRVWRYAQDQPKKLLHWYVLGTKATPPPDLFKQRLIQRFGRHFDIDTFVETGTYKGDMTAAAARTFAHVYSIELNKGFFDKAVERFADTNHVEILFGDSAEMIGKLLPTLKKPAIFWLDAHGGDVSRKDGDMDDGPAPLVAEVETILANDKAGLHVILVDDVHTFMRDVKWGRGVWRQLEIMKNGWLAQHPDWTWNVEDNVLRIYKKRG